MLIYFFVLSTGKRRFNIKLWKTFTDCFNCLPIAAIVDEKIFCCHGGLSPDLQSMEQIRRIMRPTDVPDTGRIIILFIRETFNIMNHKFWSTKKCACQSANTYSALVILT